MKIQKTWKNTLLSFLLVVALAVTMTPAAALLATDESHADDSDCLTFTALKDDSSVAFDWNSNYYSVQYSKNGEDWAGYSKGARISLDTGDFIRFKSNGMNTDAIDHPFTMTGKIAASGDITSLINGTGGSCGLTGMCFYAMFNGCTSLYTAPNIPASSTSSHSCALMFENCSNIKLSTQQDAEYTEPWIIPTESEGEGWNLKMFEGTGGSFTGNPAPNTTYYQRPAPAAFIGDKDYASLQAAFDAVAEGETIELLKDIDKDTVIKTRNVNFKMIIPGNAKFEGTFELTDQLRKKVSEDNKTYTFYVMSGADQALEQQIQDSQEAVEQKITDSQEAVEQKITDSEEALNQKLKEAYEKISAFSALTVEMYLNAAGIPAITAKVTDNEAKVSWSQNANASGYYVYSLDKDGKTYNLEKKITKGDKTYYNDATPAKSYKVQAYRFWKNDGKNTITKGKMSKAANLTIGKPSIKKLTPGKNCVTAKWSNVAGATKYNIYYKQTGKAAKSVTVKASVLSKKITKLTKGKYCTVKVRALYSKNGISLTGAWSASKKVKVK